MGKVLILTGGSSGIGKATVELFAKNGYTVYELSRHGVDIPASEGTGGVTHINCDVTIPENCKKAVERVLKEVGRIDVLISNAGMGISGAVEFTDIAEAKRQFDVNLFGSVNITQAVLAQMRKQGFGTIIFVSSVAAVFAIPFQAFYSASKSALSAFAMALRNEVAPFGIDVCCLLPGDVKTGFTKARSKSLEGCEVYTHMNKAVANMEKDEQAGITPEKMAQKLYDMTISVMPSPFYTVGLIYHLFLLLGKLLPASIVYRILGKMY